jgi:hypothetical protein
MALKHDACSFCNELQRDQINASRLRRQLLNEQERSADIDLKQFMALEPQIRAVTAWSEAATFTLKTHLSCDHGRQQKTNRIRPVSSKGHKRPVAA